MGIKREIIARETPVVRTPIEKSISSSKQELCLGFLTSVMFRSNRNFRFTTAISGLERYTQLMRISHCPVFFFVSLDRCSARKETPDAAEIFIFGRHPEIKSARTSIFSLFTNILQVLANYSDRIIYHDLIAY